jgi:hypothetical protein
LKTRGGKTPVGSNPTAPALGPMHLRSDSKYPKIKFIKNC